MKITAETLGYSLHQHDRNPHLCEANRQYIKNPVAQEKIIENVDLGPASIVSLSFMIVIQPLLSCSGDNQVSKSLLL